MLKLANVSFAYDNKPILKNISFEVKAGDHVSVIGESGCGKSTLLQLIYGLHHTNGKIFWGEKELLGPNFNLVPGEPFFKYLAQDFDLMLPLTVADNIGKYLSNMYPRKKKQRVMQLLEVVEMQEFAEVKAKHLSGGQQQRVALARALAKEPELILLDEPFSHIDQFRKNNLRRKVFRYLKEKNITCITATHDSTDALSFADVTIVLKDGKILAEKPPENLYRNPPSKYIASLFGDINEIKIKHLIPSHESSKKILVYPHEITVAKDGAAKVMVKQNYFKGNQYEIEAELNGQTIFMEHHERLEPGIMVAIKISQELLAFRQH